MHLTLRQLQFFVEIVDAGNMTAAAGRLNVAPTALSLQVKTMEEHLGVRLLERHSRGVTPTSAGVELHAKGRQILAMVAETERLVAPRTPAAPRRLRLGAPPSVLRLVGLDVAQAAGGQASGVVIQLAEGFSRDLAARLEAGELNFVLVSEITPSASMHMLEVIEERLVFVTQPAHARETRRITLAEALASELIFYGEDGLGWRVIHEAAQAAGLAVNATRQVGSIDVIRQMVRSGLGTAILPFGIVEKESRAGELAVHAIHDHPIRRRMSLAWLMDQEEEGENRAAIQRIVRLMAELHTRANIYSRPLLNGARSVMTASMPAAHIHPGG